MADQPRLAGPMLVAARRMQKDRLRWSKPSSELTTGAELECDLYIGISILQWSTFPDFG